MLDKPELRIDLKNSAAGSLPALDHLASLADIHSYHDRLGVRHPLGIYNLSVERVCTKAKACASKLEALIGSVRDLAGLDNETEELVDYVELCLYAAAEHVDDIECVAACLFEKKVSQRQSPHMRALLKDMKTVRDRPTAITNALKHHQARIRLYSLEFQHDNRPMCLHGMFVNPFMREGWGHRLYSMLGWSK